jgi:HPt (histidine-containing phosphotransfer) domain-containing protein
VNANDSAARLTPEHLLDPGALGQLSRDVGAESLGALLAAFQAELHRRQGPLRSAIDAGDLEAVASLTHAIKGSALTFGAIALGEASSRANALARLADADARTAAEQVMALIEPTLAEVSRQAMETCT